MTSIKPRIVLPVALLLASAFPAAAEPVRIALDWTPNTNHVGLYVAQELGYFDEAGLEVEILPYTDAAVGTLIANRVADFGVVDALQLYSQHSAGVDIIAVYAVVQTETGRIVLNADRQDIARPADLDGLVYAGFGSAWEDRLISTLIRNDGGDGTFETVTLGTSAYEALANGSVDFTMEVVTWEGVKAELEGTEQRRFRYADYGVPDQHTNFIASSTAFLEAEPETARAFLEALRRGYAFAVENEEEAARLLVAANPTALPDDSLARASLAALNEGHYLASETGAIGTIDPEKFAAMGEFLFTSGMLLDVNAEPLAERPDFSAYFTNAYLPEDAQP
ncbi:ABC transporter substrate-binding protein [Arsenicitalea aurantiaca]|uniref:Thiamine pyrimidine synthase n=1 Tax=Arsenicitalea aurantiaca TaxID=1783274 RepID=A0A433XBB3_9HYPH|nr:ABC transporter substrate-binding protein [Arsenicitalea aurantiaca]RUT31369.1 ABC transporter substrate-binding protein [Arsenicitalea aurantiaca]